MEEHGTIDLPLEPPEPLASHRLAGDPVTTAAHQRIDVGDRTVFALSDGFLAMSRGMLGTPDDRTLGYEALAAQYGEPRLPLGCFLIPGEVNVLIDTGFGPGDYNQRGTMIGGNLLPQLACLGFAPEDIDIVALSHLHGDHAGQVGQIGSGTPTFSRARTIFGAGDWSHFVEGADQDNLAPHTRAALESLMESDQIELLDREIEIAPGIVWIAAPGHTPGHGFYVVSDHGERLLILGDAMYCPQQLTDLEWSVAWDVDPGLARRTRESLSRDLDEHGGSAIGCHFPALIAGRGLSSPA